MTRERFPPPSRLLLRSRRLTVAAAVVAVALSLVAALQPDWLLTVDRPISEAVRGDALVDFFRFWTMFGSQRHMLVAAVVVGALLWPRCRPFALAFPLALVLGVLLDVVLKVVVDRPRPPEPIVGTALGSFPSGHAITAVIAFGLLPPVVWIVFRVPVLFWASIPIAVLVGVLVVISRVYLGAHWPSDVTASLFIGLSVLLLTEHLLGTAPARRACRGCPLHRRRSETGLDHERPGGAT